MTNKLTVRTPADIARAVPRLIGFHPTDSLVVVGIGGGPLARVDYSTVDELPAIARALETALTHWQNGVVVVVYGNPLLAGFARVAGENILPGIEVHDYIAVHDGTIQSLNTGQSFVLDDDLTGSDLDAVKVAATREDLANAASEVSDAFDAERLALASYEAGNGARAWCYHDRAVELRGEQSETMEWLADRLTRAIPPSV